MIARLTVVDGTLTEYPLAEKVRGGWQNGVTFYPDEKVTEFKELRVTTVPPTEAYLVVLDTLHAMKGHRIDRRFVVAANVVGALREAGHLAYPMSTHHGNGSHDA